MAPSFAVYVPPPGEGGVVCTGYLKERAFGAGTRPLCLVIAGFDGVIRVFIRLTSDMSWVSTVFYPDHVVTSEGFIGTVYLLSFREPVTTADVTIFRAQGPNAGGSFTSRAGENRLSLGAGVTPASLAPTIQWEIVDDPTDAVTTFEPNGVTPPFGSNVEAFVPAQDAGRWAAIPHRGSLTQKSLALRVTAAVDGSGTLIRSTPAVVRQDEIDTVREEYIELGLVPPGRGQFTGEPPVEVGLNTGDYGVMVWSDAFTTVLNALRFAWTASWQINSQYRNPVHQKWHVGSETNSAHQYSCAADLQTCPARVEDAATHERHFRTVQDSLTASQYWTALADLADRQGFIVEPLKASKIGHVHVQKAC